MNAFKLFTIKTYFHKSSINDYIVQMILLENKDNKYMNSSLMCPITISLYMWF